MKNKNIITTGISKGIGESLCKYYSNDNKVYGISRNKYEANNVNIMHFQCDLVDENQIRKTVKDIVKECGLIDVLINNAALLKTLPISLMSDKDIKDIVSVNLLGVIFMTKYVIRHMTRAKAGRIINISSMAPKLSVVGDSVYAATKAGLESFSKVINKESHGANITVNNIGVSAVHTGMLNQIVNDNPDVILKLIPHGKLATVETIVKLIEYFCDDDCLDIGGQTVYLGGIS